MNFVPEPSLRRVMFNGQTWHLTGAKDDRLCRFCGRLPTCAIAMRLGEMESKLGITVPVVSCRPYRPVLAFRPPLEGFSGTFNTFRLGTSWYQRIPDGVIVVLWDTVTQRSFGLAKVIERVVGSVEEMTFAYAHENHLFLGRERKEAADGLKRVLSRFYGKHLAGSDAKVTVVKMVRSDGKGEATSTAQEG